MKISIHFNNRFIPELEGNLRTNENTKMRILLGRNSKVIFL